MKSINDPASGPDLAEKQRSLLDGAAFSPGTDRTLAILEILSEHRAGMTVAEMVRALGVSQNSAFRITNTLHERGYVHRRESDKRYVLSNRLFDLSRPQVEGKSLAVCAYEALKELRNETRETAQLMVRANGKGVVLEQVVGLHAVKVMGEIGLRVPLYSCAPGKAILAWLPDEELKTWMKGARLRKFTPNTLATKEALSSDLEKTRRRGYAVDLAEGLEGIHCVGAPVLDSYEYPVAAVTVMAPSFRLAKSDFAALGAQCVAAAKAIRERLLA